MQWTSGRNGGFSDAVPSRLPVPVVEDGFGPEHVNVEAQRRDPDSLLHFMTLLIQRYRECPELGCGELEVLDQPHESVFAHQLTWDDTGMVALHNLGPEPRIVPFELHGCAPGTALVDLLCDGVTQLDEKGRAEVTLEGFGFRWLRVKHPHSRRLS
jgi:glycosidase